MRSSQFKVVASFPNAHQAELISSILRENGINSFANNAETSVSLSHIGLGLGGVQVMVNGGDIEEATAILAELESNKCEPWKCGNCQSEVDEGFDVCWKCGASREEAAFDPGIQTESYQVESIDKVGFQQFPPVDGKHPYQAPITSPTKEQSDAPEKDSSVQVAAEEMVDRAWRASILGLILLPGVCQAYSLYLLIRASLTSDQLSPKHQGRYTVTLVLNLIGGLIVGFLIRGLFS